MGAISKFAPVRELLNSRFWGLRAGVAGWRFRARFFFMEVTCKGAPVDSPGVLEAALTTQGLARTREPSQTEEVTECSKSGGYSPPR